MPATGNQTFENCSLGAFAVEMKHLRIKFVSKLDKLLLGHFKRLGFEPITRFQIVEVVLFHSENWRNHIHEPLLRIEQSVKFGAIR